MASVDNKEGLPKVSKRQFLKLGAAAVGGIVASIAVGKPNAAEAEAAKKPEIPLINKVEIPVPDKFFGLQSAVDAQDQVHWYGSLPDSVEAGGNELYEIDKSGKLTRVVPVSSRQFSADANQFDKVPKNPSGIEKVAALTNRSDSTSHLNYLDMTDGLWTKISSAGTNTEQVAFYVRKILSADGRVAARFWTGKIKITELRSYVYFGSQYGGPLKTLRDQEKPLKNPQEWYKEQISKQLENILKLKNQSDYDIPDSGDPAQKPKVHVRGARELVGRLLGDQARQQNLSQEKIIQMITNKLMQDYQQPEGNKWDWVEAPDLLLYFDNFVKADVQTKLFSDQYIYVLGTDDSGMFLHRGEVKQRSNDYFPFPNWDYSAPEVSHVFGGGKVTLQSLTIDPDGVAHIVHRQNKGDYVTSVDYRNPLLPWLPQNQAQMTCRSS